MRALVLREFGSEPRVEEVPEPSADGIEVRISATGLCRTDLHIVEGLFPEVVPPRILGHEIAGEAEGFGPVLILGAWGCGKCSRCAAGEEQLCRDCVNPGFEVDGGFAECIVVPDAGRLVSLGDIDPMAGAPLADAGLTPYRAARRARPWLEPRARAVVIGAGGLGQFAIQYVRLFAPDARISVVETSASKRERSLVLGADDAVAPEELDGSADVVFDFVGTDDSLELAARTVRPAGALMLVGEAGGRIAYSASSLPPETTLTTSFLGTREELEEVVSLASSGRITWEIEPLPLDRAPEALARLRAGDVSGRLVLVP
jgi:propanol-preferring alcohol dehydrogenase